ncbi:MAG: hypothetical protein ABI771_03860 [Betaproteobacteria bacterium]
MASGIGTLVALSVAFTEMDWPTTLTFLIVVAVAGCVVGGMTGAVLGDEIVGTKLRRFG